MSPKPHRKPSIDEAKNFHVLPKADAPSASVPTPRVDAPAQGGPMHAAEAGMIGLTSIRTPARPDMRDTPARPALDDRAKVS